MQTRASIIVSIFGMLLLGMLLSTACNKSNDDNTTPGGSNPPAAGIWKISYFFDKQIETSNYAGYTFEFKTDGALIAQNGAQTWNGTWSTNCDDSANKFCIFFAGSVPSVLIELQEDWLILEKTSNLMHFEHTSGGNGDTDVVHFTRQ
ncbi:MAG: hypothetical protein IPM98_19590 [Lewinellaceae bacterium]|nr:hypothetical protein [Lewinellaceae bacterium]